MDLDFEHTETFINKWEVKEEPSSSFPSESQDNVNNVDDDDDYFTEQIPRLPELVDSPITDSHRKGRETLSCEECGESFNNDYLFNRHRQLHGQGFPCPHCPAQFTIRHNLTTHVKRMHPDVLLKLRMDSTCPTCKKICPSPQALERHVKFMHKKKKIQKKEIQCQECDEMVSNAEQHMAGHGSGFLCPYCPREKGEFVSYKILFAHKVSTHAKELCLGGWKLFNKACPFCATRCKTYEKLNRHCVAKHEGRRIWWDESGVVREDKRIPQPERKFEGFDAAPKRIHGKRWTEMVEIQPEIQPDRDKEQVANNVMMKDPLKIEMEDETILGLDQNVSIPVLSGLKQEFGTCSEDIYTRPGSSSTTTVSGTGRNNATRTSMSNRKEMVFTSVLDSELVVVKENKKPNRNKNSRKSQREEKNQNNNQTEIDSDDERFLDQLEMEQGIKVKLEVGEELQVHGDGNFHELIEEEASQNNTCKVEPLTNLDGIMYKVKVEADQMDDDEENNIFL